MTTLIIVTFCLLLIIGLLKIRQLNIQNHQKLNFASEFLERLKSFSEKYAERRSESEMSEYIWLVKNSNRIQNDLGVFGLMEYIGPFQKFKTPMVNTQAFSIEAHTQ